MNLACAAGLPGSEALDAGAIQRRITDWAQRVRGETNRHLYRFHQAPAEYRNSEAYFRVLMLVTVLQQDCGVQYNPARAASPDFHDSRDLFLPGLLGQGSGGTCVSMPVLYAAVGRQLGYPIKLVQAKSHLFCRWDDGKERFNIEATNQGLNTFDDAYYRTWPQAILPNEEGWYLRSLTADEELACFLAIRGDCLEANGRLDEALLAYAQAHRLAPSFPPYLAAAKEIAGKGLEQSLRPPVTNVLRPMPETTRPSQ